MSGASEAYPAPCGIVSLLTDFGTSEPFVGVMKGVMLGLDAQLRFVDFSHQIAPQAVASAAYWLEKAFSYLPPGSVHLVVVDPGVGTSRAALAAHADGHYFVAPDNGVLSRVLRRDPCCSVVALELPSAPLSNTFHGRDLFAPAAAKLAGRVPLRALGRTVDSWVELPHAATSRAAGKISGEVVLVDHFGNLITDVELSPDQAARVQSVSCRGRSLPWGRSYADVPTGSGVALLNSWGCVELAVAGGNAAAVFGAGIGDPIEVLTAD